MSMFFNSEIPQIMGEGLHSNSVNYIVCYSSKKLVPRDMANYLVSMTVYKFKLNIRFSNCISGAQ